MMANDWQRLNIWLNLKNRFDYREFESVCVISGTNPQPKLEFAQKAGMVAASMIEYPELPVAEAYIKFVQENQTAFAPPQSQLSPQTKDGVLVGFKKEKATITYADGRTEEQDVIVPDGKQQSCCGGGAVK